MIISDVPSPFFADADANYCFSLFADADFKFYAD